MNVNNAVVLVALLIALTWVWNTIVAIQRNFSLQQQVDNLAAQNDLLDLQNRTRAFENQYYKSNEYLELSAREHLGKASPGEKMLILPANTVNKADAKHPVSSDDVPVSERSNFAQWMYFLFGKKN